MLPSLTDLQQAAGVDVDVDAETGKRGLSKRARRGVSLYCLGWLCMIGGDEVGVLLLGPYQPTLTPTIGPRTVASAVFWIGMLVALGSVVILIREAKNETEK